MEIEEVSEIDSIFSHVQETWNHLGNTDPYWSVLTQEKFKQNSEKEIPDQFYLSGRDDVAILVNSLERNGIDYRRLKTCLEIGCGTGRVTRWLADYFDQVFGCDISQSHLNLASRYLDQTGTTNVSFRHIKTPKEFCNLPTVDIVYSIMVLQHNPPPLMVMIIREMLKSLLPGGIAFFQVPTYRLGYKFSLDKYLLDNDAKLELEMHILPQYKIFEIAAKENGDIIEVLEDGYVGLAYGARSNIFIIRKKRALF